MKLSYYRRETALLLSAICLSGFSHLFSQSVSDTKRTVSVNLHFPRFSGKLWDFLLIRGQIQDTVLSGKIPDDGTVRITLPQNRSNYKGMGRWMLRDGGGLDMVLNGESFSVSCLSDQPNDQNIIYSGSSENKFLRDNTLEQDKLLRQAEVLGMIVVTYPPAHSLSQTARAEQLQLNSRYKQFRQQLSASPLYAARFREIVDITRGIGSSLQQTELEKARDIETFMQQQLSWEALYTSNHWNGVIYNWGQMHTVVFKNDSLLLNSARKILARIKEPEVYTAFCESMVRLFVQNGKDSALFVLAPEVKKSGKLIRTDGLLAQFKAVGIGETAPDLIIEEHIGDPADHNHKTTVLKTKEMGSAYTLLLFYQSGCGPCEQTVQQLQGNYTWLKDLGVRLVSLSADMDLQIFENTARNFPWKDKFCDSKGMAGPNFKNYGVTGTPTLFIVDESGTIRGRFAELSKVLEWVKGQTENKQKK